MGLAHWFVWGVGERGLAAREVVGWGAGRSFCLMTSGIGVVSAPLQHPRICINAGKVPRSLQEVSRVSKG